jgi:hypothetical protein
MMALTMGRCTRSAATLCLSLAAASSVWASSLCRTVSHSETVAIVVCSPASGQADWKSGGAAACQGKSRCNAWIWDDETKAPKVAPEKDTDLPKSQTGAARAVLITPGNDLILVRKVK